RGLGLRSRAEFWPPNLSSEVPRRESLLQLFILKQLNPSWIQFAAFALFRMSWGMRVIPVPAQQRSLYWLLTERHLSSRPDRIDTEDGTAPHKRSITSCWV